MSSERQSFRQYLLGALRRSGLISIILPAANAFYEFRKWNARRRGEDELLAVYDEKYFVNEEEMTIASSGRVVDILMDMFEPQSVMDVGCGTAVYLEEFYSRGLRVYGVDGSRDAINNARVPAEFVACHDLREPIDTMPAFDLVICFEVGEHLSEQYSDGLVSNIIRCGDTVVFSAAQPGQGGVDHVNEQKPEFWITRFQSAGYALEADLTQELRGRFATDDVAWWLPRNVLVFREGLEPT